MTWASELTRNSKAERLTCDFTFWSKTGHERKTGFNQSRGRHPVLRPRQSRCKLEAVAEYVPEGNECAI